MDDLEFSPDIRALVNITELVLFPFFLLVLGLTFIPFFMKYRREEREHELELRRLHIKERLLRQEVSPQTWSRLDDFLLDYMPPMLD